LLASTTGGLDQSTTHGNRTPTSYICHGCLISSRGVIFPGSHRGGDSIPFYSLGCFFLLLAT
jgi:hypothetical protein